MLEQIRYIQAEIYFLSLSNKNKSAQNEDKVLKAPKKPTLKISFSSEDSVLLNKKPSKNTAIRLAITVPAGKFLNIFLPKTRHIRRVIAPTPPNMKINIDKAMTAFLML